jgi:transposase
MATPMLLPDADEVAWDSVKFDRETVILVVHAVRSHATCPLCHQPSGHIHSRYSRRLADLPWNEVPVRIELLTRRFFCRTSGCGQRIFTERLPNTTVRHARKTNRLIRLLDQLTHAMGGEGGAMVARGLGISTSGDQLLRQLRRKPIRPFPTPTVLGIDDWAWRKGQRYGTILCDLERHMVVDLLADRRTETVATWLRDHPGIEVISRDRAGAYAEAATKAAPRAVQVADRWHLLRNLTDALQHCLASQHGVLRQAAKAMVTPSQSRAAPCLASAPAQPSTPRPATRLERLRNANRSRRLDRYRTVIKLLRQGLSQSAISVRLGIDRRTVRRWVRAGRFPERARVQRHSSLDCFADYLQRRYRQGCHNAARLWRELHEQGFQGCSGMVRQWIRRLRPSLRQPKMIVPPLMRITGSPRQTAWLILQQPPEAGQFLAELYRRSQEIAAAATVARQFSKMIRQSNRRLWRNWLKAALKTPLAGFAKQLSRDQDAVRAALRLPWSKGQVEGQVHRLKLIKRQMYGRAKFDLLRLRVLPAA